MCSASTGSLTVRSVVMSAAAPPPETLALSNVDPALTVGADGVLTLTETRTKSSRCDACVDHPKTHARLVGVVCPAITAQLRLAAAAGKFPGVPSASTTPSLALLE